MKFYVYKYVNNNTIIYIGKTDDIARRVAEHASGQGLEEKFLPYLEESDIYFHECGNEIEMSALERLLINQFKPKLNVVDAGGCISTVSIDMDWSYYNANQYDGNAEIERVVSQCQKNIASNETRIRTYQEECKKLQDLTRRLLPFYQYLHCHANDFARRPDAYFAVPESILPSEKSIHIGPFVVDEWADDIMFRDGNTWVQFNGELMRHLFAMVHKDTWIDESIYEAGEKRRQSILKKVANLRRRNAELTAKKETLRRKLHEEVF